MPRRARKKNVAARFNKERVCAAGEHYIMSVLARLQIMAFLAPRNAPDWDIGILWNLGGRTLYLNSKATTYGTCRLGKRARFDRSDFFYVMVDFKRQQFTDPYAHPDVYVIPAVEMRPFLDNEGTDDVAFRPKASSRPKLEQYRNGNGWRRLLPPGTCDS